MTMLNYPLGPGWLEEQRRGETERDNERDKPKGKGGADDAPFPRLTSCH